MAATWGFVANIATYLLSNPANLTLLTGHSPSLLGPYSWHNETASVRSIGTEAAETHRPASEMSLSVKSTSRDPEQSHQVVPSSLNRDRRIGNIARTVILSGGVVAAGVIAFVSPALGMVIVVGSAAFSVLHPLRQNVFERLKDSKDEPAVPMPLAPGAAEPADLIRSLAETWIAKSAAQATVGSKAAELSAIAQVLTDMASLAAAFEAAGTSEAQNDEAA